MTMDTSWQHEAADTWLRQEQTTQDNAAYEVQTWGWNRSRASCSRISKNYYSRAAITTSNSISIWRRSVRSSSSASPCECCNTDRIKYTQEKQIKKKWILSTKK